MAIPSRRLGGLTKVDVSGWQHRYKNFQPKVLLIVQTISFALYHTDLVVETFDKSQRDLRQTREL
jgi:hypothetical protein